MYYIETRDPYTGQWHPYTGGDPTVDNVWDSAEEAARAVEDLRRLGAEWTDDAEYRIATIQD